MPNDIFRYKLTYTLIAINVLVYLFSAFLSHSIVDMDMETLVHMGALFGPYTIQDGEWWRVFAAMFLHGGLTHILMNMFSLYIVGRAAEIYFDLKSYLGIYLFSGLIGGFASLSMHPESVGVGASGAIFGLFGALAGFFLAHAEKISAHSKAFMKEFAIIIGINLLIGFSIPEVDVSAHVGGLFAGMLGGFLVSKNQKFFLLYSLAMFLVVAIWMPYLSSQYAQVHF